MTLTPWCSRPAGLSALAMGLLLTIHSAAPNAQQRSPLQTPLQSSVPRSGSQLAAVDAATIARVQQRLLDLGYNPGPADGAMGRRTQRRDHQLSAR